MADLYTIYKAARDIADRCAADAETALDEYTACVAEAEAAYAAYIEADGAATAANESAAVARDAYAEAMKTEEETR